jgi:hypothetical protein
MYEGGELLTLNGNYEYCVRKAIFRTRFLFFKNFLVLVEMCF